MHGWDAQRLHVERRKGYNSLAFGLVGVFSLYNWDVMGAAPLC